MFDFDLNVGKVVREYQVDGINPITDICAEAKEGPDS